MKGGGSGTTLLILCCCCILLIVGISGGAYAALRCDEDTKTGCFCDMDYCNASETCEENVNGSGSSCVLQTPSGQSCTNSAFKDPTSCASAAAAATTAEGKLLVEFKGGTCSSDTCTHEECCMIHSDAPTSRFNEGPDNPCQTGVCQGVGISCFPDGVDETTTPPVPKHVCKCTPGYTKKGDNECKEDFNWDIIQHKKYVEGGWECEDNYYKDETKYPDICIPCGGGKQSFAGSNHDSQSCKYYCGSTTSLYNNDATCSEAAAAAGTDESSLVYLKDKHGECEGADCTLGECCGTEQQTGTTTHEEFCDDASNAKYFSTCFSSADILTAYETQKISAHCIENSDLKSCEDLLDYLNNKFVTDDVSSESDSTLNTKQQKSLYPGRYKIDDSKLTCNVIDPLGTDIAESGDDGIEAAGKCLYNIENCDTAGSLCNASGIKDGGSSSCIWGSHGELNINCECKVNFYGSLCQIEGDELCNKGGKLEDRESLNKYAAPSDAERTDNLFGYRYSVEKSDDDGGNILKIKPNYNSSLYYLNIDPGSYPAKTTAVETAMTLPSIYAGDIPCICDVDTHNDRKGFDYQAYKFSANTLCNCPTDEYENIAATDSQGAQWVSFYKPGINKVNDSNSIDNMRCVLDCPSKPFTPGDDIGTQTGDQGYKTGHYYSYPYQGTPECNICDRTHLLGHNGIKVDGIYGVGEYDDNEILTWDNTSFDNMFHTFSTDLSHTCKPAYPGYYGTVGTYDDDDSKWKKNKGTLYAKHENKCGIGLPTQTQLPAGEWKDIDGRGSQAPPITAGRTVESCKDDCTTFAPAGTPFKAPGDRGKAVDCSGFNYYKDPATGVPRCDFIGGSADFTEYTPSIQKGICSEVGDPRGATVLGDYYEKKNLSGGESANKILGRVHEPRPVDDDYNIRTNDSINFLNCPDNKSLNWSPLQFGVKKGKCDIQITTAGSQSLPLVSMGETEGEDQPGSGGKSWDQKPLGPARLDLTQPHVAYEIKRGGRSGDGGIGSFNDDMISTRIAGTHGLDGPAGEHLKNQWEPGLKSLCNNWYKFDDKDIKVATVQVGKKNSAGNVIAPSFGWNNDKNCGGGTMDYDCGNARFGCTWETPAANTISS